MVAPTMPVVAPISTPDQDDADAHAAAQAAGQMADDVHQVVGDLGFLQHHAHEHEQRDGDQRVVGRHAVDAGGQQIEQAGAKAEIAPEQPADGQRQRDRHADRQQHEERDDAQDRQQLGVGHVTPCAWRF